MKTNLFGLAVFSAILTACSTSGAVRDADLRIFDHNVLGASYVVCESQIKWDGVNFTIDGLETGEESAFKKFTIGKIDYNQKEIRQLDTLALSIDHLFRQMCSSTIALRNQPKALAEYVKSRDVTALKVFDVLKEMESINRSSTSSAETIAAQQKLYSSVSQE